MKHLSRATLTLAGVCVLLAIWAPVGSWWQWAITALLFLLAGAGFGASADKPRDTSGEVGNSSGPHLRFDKSGQVPGPTTIKNDTGKPERIVPASASDDERTAEIIWQQRANRIRYGKPSKENDQR